MIVRYALECDQCHTVTMLRFGIGPDDVQTFQFECGECSHVIKGRLPLEPATGTIGKLEVDGATLDREHSLPADFSKYPHVVTIHPAFPSVRSSDAAEAFSPFMAAFQRHGLEGLVNRLSRSAGLDGAGQAQNILIPVVRSYQKARWNAFDAGVRAFRDATPLGNQSERDAALYLVVDEFLSPLINSQTNTRLLDGLRQYVSDQKRDHPNGFDKAVDELERLGVLADVQSTALDAVLRLFELTSEFRPLIIEWDPENPDAALRPELGVEGRARFNDVKSLYVDAYETCARGLTIVLALINLAKRGDAGAFIPHPLFAKGKKNTPFAASLADFVAKAHGGKVHMLTEEPQFETWLIGALDSQLRNAIGHNTVKYRADQSEVDYATDRQGTKWKTISYGEFLFRILRMVVRAHQMNHLLAAVRAAR